MRYFFRMILFAGVVTVLIGAISSFHPVFAQYSNICNDLSVSEADLQRCEIEYNSCVSYPSMVSPGNEDAYDECVGNEGCNAINRYTTYDAPDDCVNWQENLTPGTNAYDWYDEIEAYCTCVEQCQLQYFMERDCEEELSECCAAASSGDEEDEDTKITISEDLEVTIKALEGDVEVQIDGGGYRDAVVGDKLHVGDYIVTGFESKATLIFEKVAEIDVKEMTHFAIGQFYVQGNLAKTAVSLRMGEVTTHVHTPKGVRASFEIESPTSTAGVRGTTFKVRYSDDTGLTEYYVYDGILEITDSTNGTVTELDAGGTGSFLYVESDGFVSDIYEIPDGEELTSEEIALFAEYADEDDSYGTMVTDGYDGTDDTTVLYLICGGCVCLLAVGGVVVLVLLLTKRKKKSKES